MAFFDDVRRVLPERDTSSRFRGDRLLAVPPGRALEFVRQLVRDDPRAIRKLAVITSEKIRHQPEGHSEPMDERQMSLATLCESWVSGDSVGIVRYRNDALKRMAILERISKTIVLGKMQLGPAHTSWSDTDEALFEIGIRTVKTHVANPRVLEKLQELPGHTVAEGLVTVSYEAFRNANRSGRGVGDG